MAEPVEVIAGVGDDFKSLMIQPQDEILENSYYEVTVSGVKSKDGTKTLPPVTLTFMTPLNPMYCSVKSVRALVDAYGIPERNLRLYIHEASEYADYILSQSGTVSESTKEKRMFALQQFVRTKVTMDCINSYMMSSTATGVGSRYKLDVVEVEESMNASAMKAMLDALRKDLDKWQDAIRGYFPEGRAKPKATRVGLKANQNSDVPHTTVDKILDSISRTPPDGSD